jgi:hypothetical protein
LRPTASRWFLAKTARSWPSGCSSVPPKGGESSAAFENLPLGTLVATATAHPNADENGVAQARVSTALTIAAGENTPVCLSPNSTIAEGCMTPPSPVSVHAISRRTAEVVASALDTEGNIILREARNWRWAVVDPSVVTVALNGERTVLSGESVGTTQVWVAETESGKVVTGTGEQGPAGGATQAAPAPPKYGQCHAVWSVLSDLSAF